MTEVDVRGFSCPIPVIKTKKAMEDNPGDTLTVLLETGTSKENISRLAASRGYSFSEEEVPGGFRLTLTPTDR